jgi:predicted DNA-binding antitoxin AbrB/MazE fold protein
MTITVDATYDKGVLVLDQSLPFQDRERVRVNVTGRGSETAAPGSLPPKERLSPEEIEERLRHVRNSAGIFRWTGDTETLERIAMHPEFSIDVGRNSG